MTSSVSSSLQTRRGTVILSIVPVVTVGLLLATFAIWRMPWPPDQPATTRYGISVTFAERLQGEQIGVSTSGNEDADWYARRGLDGLVVVALLIGYAGTALLITFDEPYLVMAVSAVGALGIIYGIVVGFYPGPMVAGSGFGLMLFGAGFGWLSRVTGDKAAQGGSAPVRESSTGNDEL